MTPDDAMRKLQKQSKAVGLRVSMIHMVRGFTLPSTISVHTRIRIDSLSRRILLSRYTTSQMSRDNMKLIHKNTRANFRLCNVAGYKTDLLEIHAQNPAFHVLFIAGNPGVVQFYTDFVESLYELLGGGASVTAIGHVSHTEKNREHGRLFSLQEQIDHKMSFLEQELQDVEIPIFLVGHSIGAYISIEMFKRSPEKVRYCICLYPFLAVNTKSSTQSMIRKIAASPLMCTAVSSIVAFFGMLPVWTSRFLITSSIGKLWTTSAVDALCTHVLQYHSMRNVLFMARTEFKELSKTPDWDFIREKRSQMAFLFGVDDHWGPMHLFEEISKQVQDAVLAVEREGHSHAFSCTEAGSLWVAQHVASLIKNYTSNSSL